MILIVILQVLLVCIMGILALYVARHFRFTWSRVLGEQRYPYMGFGEFELPSVTILVPAHNEEAVIGGSLTALLELDYPADRFTIVPVNDRSRDRTREIIDELARANPGRIHPFHREAGKPGKAAALRDITPTLTTDLIIVFDADYLPIPGLLRNLVAPFCDPEVGAVMGRVVPMNVSSNLLTRMLDLERSGGYQVDQQARMNLGLIPQYGGTVGGVRRVALEEIGGWDDSILAEDTDVTFRLYMKGWSVVYQNGCECYEEVPETWRVRQRQIMRWAKGHNHVMLRQLGNVLRCPTLSFSKKLDGALLLGIYMLSPITILGWLVAVFLFYTDHNQLTSSAVALFSILAFSSVGNFALFFEIGSAVHLDGYRNRVRLLPLGLVYFLVSLFCVSKAICTQLFIDIPTRRKLVWHKTSRYRPTGAP